jgi:dynein heavy chain 1
MVWFSEDVLSTEMIFENYMSRLRNIPLEEVDEDSGFGKKAENKEDIMSPALQVFSTAYITHTCRLSTISACVHI